MQLTVANGNVFLLQMERYVDRKLDQVDSLVSAKEKKARGWFQSKVKGSGYELQEIHIFVLSFAAGVAFGLASA